MDEEFILKSLTKNKSGIVSCLDELEKCEKSFFTYAFIYYNNIKTIYTHKIGTPTKLFYS